MSTVSWLCPRKVIAQLAGCFGQASGWAIQSTASSKAEAGSGCTRRWTTALRRRSKPLRCR